MRTFSSREEDLGFRSVLKVRGQAPSVWGFGNTCNRFKREVLELGAFECSCDGFQFKFRVWTCGCEAKQNHLLGFVLTVISNEHGRVRMMT